jgi:5'-3' exonuclease
MGVKGLLRFINTLTKDAIVERHLSYYKNRRVGIDASIYMYRYQMDGKNFIDEFMKMILQLKKFQIDIYFLFDGKSDKEKEDTLKERKQEKNKKKQELEIILTLEQTIENSNLSKEAKENIQEIIQKDKVKVTNRLIYINKKIINKLKELLNSIGISYIECPGEAEFYGCYLVKQHKLDFMISDDTDCIAAGCFRVVREFDYNSEYCLEYNLPKILDSLKISNNLFKILCVFMGTDFNDRVQNRNVKQILRFIQKNRYKNINDYRRYFKIYEDEKWNKFLYSYSMYNTNGFNNDNLIITNKADRQLLTEFIKENSTIEPYGYINKLYYLNF